MLLDNVRLMACALDPASQASSRRIRTHWAGLPTPAKYISHYEWAVIAAPRPSATVRGDFAVLLLLLL